MVRILPIVMLVVALAGVASAQTTCVIDVDGPTEVEPGAPIVFKAKITGTIQTTKPEFKWTVSAGEITSGQGTETITIDSTGLGGQDVTATVEISGCKAPASRTAQVKVPPPACGMPFDEYGDISFEDEKARLDNFAIQLTNIPLSTGQILMVAGQETFKNEAAERLARAKSYLVNVREIDPNRIVTLDCGFERDLRLILSISTAEAPLRTCDGYLTIPFSEVKFTKSRPKSSKRRR